MKRFVLTIATLIVATVASAAPLTDDFVGDWGLILGTGTNSCEFKMTVSAHNTEDLEGRCRILNVKLGDAPAGAEVDLACEHDGTPLRIKEFWYLRTINSVKHLVIVLPDADKKPSKNFSLFVYQRCDQ
jgi:hypothetical protein